MLSDEVSEIIFLLGTILCFECVCGPNDQITCSTKFVFSGFPSENLSPVAELPERSTSFYCFKNVKRKFENITR